jgi:O-antigen/teichoic acid export membrane protein
VPEVAALPQASTATLVHSIAARFGIFGLNAVTGIITARLLSPEGRGELAAMALWPVLIAGITTVGVPSALIYHGRRHPERLRELTASALALAALAGGVGTVIAWPLIPIWLGQHPAWVVTAAQFCLLGTVVNSLVLTGRAAWEARGDFRRSNRAQLAAPLLTIAALSALAAAGRLTPATAAIAYVAIGIPVLAWILHALARQSRTDRRENTPAATPPDAPAWRQLLHYGSRSYGVDLFGVLALYLDQALVVGLLVPEAMGMYAVGLSLARIINAVHGSVATMMFPKVVGLAPAVLTKSIARAARLGALASAALGLGIVATGPILVHVLYGAAYEAAGTLLPVLVLQVILAGVTQVLVQGLLAAGRPGAATLNQFLGLALSVPLFLVLVPSLGARGAALSLLASTAIRLALTMACYPLCLRAPLPQVWIDKGDIAELTARLS